METYLEKRESSQEELEANQEKTDSVMAHYKWAPRLKATLVLTAL
jgi:hypothetical protein